MPTHAPTPPRRSLLQNSLAVAASRLLQLGAGLAALILVARHLPVAVMGEFAYVMATAGAVMTLAYFGVQQTLVRSVATNPEAGPRLVGAAFHIRLALTGAAAVAAWGAAALGETALPAEVTQALWLAFLAEALRAFTQLTLAVYQAYERMLWEPAVTMTQNLALLGALGVVILVDGGLTHVVGAYALAMACGLCAALVVMGRHFVKPQLTPHLPTITTFLKTAAVIGLGIIFYQNIFRAAALLLRWLGGPEETAFFQAPHELVLKLQVLTLSVMLAMFPVFSRLWKENADEAARLYRLLFRLILVAAAPTSLYLAYFSHEVTTLAFGAKFAPAAPVVAVVGLAVAPLSLDMLLNNVLIAMEKQRWAAIYAGAALALTCVGCALVIPTHGALGAAWVMVAAYCFLLGCSGWLAARHGLAPQAAVTAVKTLMAVGLTLAVMRFLEDAAGAPRYAVAVAGPFAYAAAAAGLGVLPKPERERLRNALRRRRARKGGPHEQDDAGKPARSDEPGGPKGFRDTGDTSDSSAHRS